MNFSQEKINKIRELYADPKYGLTSLSLFKPQVWKQLKYHVSIDELKQIMNNDFTYSVNKRVVKPKVTRKYKPFYPFQYIQADLMEIPKDEVKANKNYRYIFTCIDVFSKFVFIYPTKTKSANDILSCFQKLVLDIEKVYPKAFNNVIQLQTDEGKEFYNKIVESFLKDNNINLYSTGSAHKAAIIERFHLTFRYMIVKYQTANSTLNFINVLYQLIGNYNNRKHTTIKMSPKEALESENELKVKSVYHENKEITKLYKTIEIGDYVRIPKKTNVFTKKSDNQARDSNVYKVYEIIQSDPVTYRLKSMNGYKLKRSYYFDQLMPINSNVVGSIELD